jgi:hypothetical protein
MRMIGLYREAECSPGQHRSNDAHCSSWSARRWGARAPGRPDDAGGSGRFRRSATVVFSMCQAALPRSADALGARGHASDQQPTGGVEYARDRLPAILEAAGLPSADEDRHDRARRRSTIEVNGGLG